MKKIFKYPIPMTDHIAIAMPAGAEVLSAQVQGDQPCVWALVDPEAPAKLVHLRVVGTGHEIPQPLKLLKFIDTIQLHGGALVFHIFVVAED